MIIYLCDKDKFNINDDYETMMSYTTTLFGMSSADYERIKLDKSITAKKIILTEQFFDNDND